MTSRYSYRHVPEVDALLADGMRGMGKAMKARMEREKVVGLYVNRCLRCERIVATPQARQCLWCGNDWHHLRECVSSTGPQRVAVNLKSGTVSFYNCHVSRSFFESYVEEERTCRFEEIVAVEDLPKGDQLSVLWWNWLAVVQLFFQWPRKPEELVYTLIRTTTGSCRIYADWIDLGDFRVTLVANTTGRDPARISQTRRVVSWGLFVVMVVLATVLLWMKGE
ncbi:hypothetical protein SH248x_001221 [Planctomycetaceae bacterium SH248]